MCRTLEPCPRRHGPSVKRVKSWSWNKLFNLPLRSFLTTIETCARYMGETSPESSSSASSTEDVLVKFRSSSQCSFWHSTISPVKVSSPPPLLNTALAKPCFLFLSCLMVCQNFLEKTWKMGAKTKVFILLFSTYTHIDTHTHRYERFTYLTR